MWRHTCPNIYFCAVRNLVVWNVWSYETNMWWTNSRRFLTKLKVENVYVLRSSNEKKKKNKKKNIQLIGVTWNKCENDNIDSSRCTRSTSNCNACISRKWIVRDRCTSLHPPCNCAQLHAIRAFSDRLVQLAWNN